MSSNWRDIGFGRERTGRLKNPNPSGRGGRQTFTITPTRFRDALLNYRHDSRINPLTANANGEPMTLYTTRRPDGTVRHCLIGQALTDCGIPQDLLDRHEGTAIFRVLDSLMLRSPADEADDIRLFAEVAQCAADSGATWSEAIAGALRAEVS